MKAPGASVVCLPYKSENKLYKICPGAFLSNKWSTNRVRTFSYYFWQLLIQLYAHCVHILNVHLIIHEYCYVLNLMSFQTIFFVLSMKVNGVECCFGHCWLSFYEHKPFNSSEIKRFGMTWRWVNYPLNLSSNSPTDKLVKHAIICDIPLTSVLLFDSDWYYDSLCWTLGPLKLKCTQMNIIPHLWSLRSSVCCQKCCGFIRTLLFESQCYIKGR